MPGIGPTIAPTIAATIGDIRRFPNARSFVRWLGLNPRKNQTGIADRSGQTLSKAGDRMLRRYLHIAAQVGRQIDPGLAAIYDRHMRKGGHHNHATTVVAHALARRIYALLVRAAHDQTSRYLLRDPQQRILDRAAARAWTRQHYPSKRERDRASTVVKNGATRRFHQTTGHEVAVPTPSDTDTESAQPEVAMT